MKKLHILVLIVMAACLTLSANLSAQCGNLYIAGVIDGPLPGGTPKAIQLCASGAIADLSTYGIESITNGGGSGGAEEFTFPADMLNAGDCTWITTDLAQFNAYFGFDACYESGTVNANGDDAFILYCGGVAEDAFGDPNTDGTGEPWEYLDGWAFSSDMAANPVFTDTDWTYSGPNALDGETSNGAAASPYPNAVANCPVIVFDCPAAMANIGDVCDDNDGATLNDVIQANCTCAGTPTGLNDCGFFIWEAVQVVNNSQLDVWSAIAGGWSMNGFVGGGNAEQVDQWLVYGPLDLSSTNTLDLSFDAAESFGDTDLNILWTAAYPGCPTDATWTNAATIADPGAISVDLSAATGTAVFIAIEYSDDGANGYSGWDLTNFLLLADVCPTLGAPMISMCAMSCSVSAVSVAGSCVGADYTYSVSFNASNGSGSYDVIDVASGAVLASGANSPISVTIAGNTSTTPFDINVVDSADNTCMGVAATVTPADCSAPSTCPASAKINEFHYDNGGTDVNEFVEIALPAGSDPTMVVVSLYNGNGGVEYASITLSSNEFVSSDGTNDYYVWNIAMQNGNDGIAVSCGGGVFQFITYEGAFMATDGPAAGAMGVDVGVVEDAATTGTQSIMCDGAGTYLTACVADPGAANDTSTCGAAAGCTDMNACNFNPDATSDDGSCFNVGDTCDDGDANTENDVYTDCMTCAGTPVGCPGGVTPGDPCDDMDPNTENDVIQADCSCAGVVPVTCPTTAKINEFHYDNAATDVNEFVEIALPAGSAPSGVVITLYNGNGGAQYGTFTLSAADFVSTDGTNDYYVWNVAMQNGNDGIAVSCGATVFQFITYEGAFMASDGPAAGTMGTDVGVEEATDAAETSSIMCDGAGVYATNCVQDPGMANDLTTCVADPTPGCTDAAACNFDPAATEDDGSCFNIGDACDDGDATTTNDVYTDCMTCAGTLPTIGCTDMDACNFNPAATQDDDSCIFAIGCDECDGSGGVTDNPEIGEACDDGDSATVNDTVQGDCSCAGVAPTCPATAKINEFHYDNLGGDVNEFVEIALPAGSDPIGVVITLYNGNGGAQYDTFTLSAADFVSTDGTNDYYVWNVAMQNGNDGIAVSCGAMLFQFITYEGAFMASDGPAAGTMGTDVGVEEASDAAETSSIMCDGAGVYATNCTQDPGMANDLSSCGIAGCTLSSGACSDCPAGNDNISIDLAAGEAFNDGAELCAAFDCFNPIMPPPDYDNSTNTGTWTLPAGVVNAFAVGGINNLNLPNVVNGGCLTADVNVISGTTPFLIEFRIENGTGAPGNGGQALVFDAMADGTGTCSMGGDFSSGTPVNGFTFTPGTVYSVVIALADFSGNPVDADIVIEVSNIALSVCAPDVPGCIDPTACNFDPAATTDDSSCIFATGCDVCDGNGGITDNPEPGEACDDGDDGTINDTIQADCTCAGEIPDSGCTDPNASNFDPLATVEDGSCLYLCDEDPANLLDVSNSGGFDGGSGLSFGSPSGMGLLAGANDDFAGFIWNVNTTGLTNDDFCISIDYTVTGDPAAFPITLEFRIENSGCGFFPCPWIDFNVQITGPGTFTLGGIVSSGNAGANGPFDPAGANPAIVAAIANFSGTPIGADLNVEFSNLCVSTDCGIVPPEECVPNIIQFPANPTGN